MGIEPLDIGMIGAGVMGGSLARNMADKGYMVGLYDVDVHKAEAVCSSAGDERKRLKVFSQLASLIAVLPRPRKIGLLVNAGKKVDEVLKELKTLLEEGDIVMDMGNSFFRDTQRREKELKHKGILFFGVGISGGEKGALYGPSIMVGSDAYGWNQAGPLLRDICAVTGQGTRCCKNFGPGGAGHFIKMVHDGIEYAYMEAIGEVYLLLRKVYGAGPKRIKTLFDQWTQNKKVNSYLLEITAQIVGKRDDLGDRFLIDAIKDRAESKETGLWTSQCALQLHTSAPVLTEALLVRYLSAEEDLRKVYRERTVSCVLTKEPEEALCKALEFIQYICFEQGLKVIEAGASTFDWSIDLADVVSVWKAGCIIRTDFLDQIEDAVKTRGDAKILAAENLAKILKDSYHGVCQIVSNALPFHVPIPVISSGVQYYLTATAETLPTVMVQAQRDYFGAHGYERLDMNGIHHTEW